MKKCNLIQNQPLPCQSFKEPLNPRTYTQNRTPTMVQEEGRWNPSMADPDLQMGRGGGGRSSRPWDKEGGPSLPTNFFRLFGPHFDRKIRGGPGPSPEFLLCCSISKRFCLHRKVFDLLNKMRYILWMVALLETCDVTNNGRHLGCHLGFYQELEIRLKQREMVIAWHE